MRQLKKRLLQKTHVIWDWNGTLVDDVDLCIDIIGEIATRHGLSPVEKEEYLRKFRFPVLEYYKDIGFTENVIDPRELTQQFISQYSQKLHQLRLYRGISDQYDLGEGLVDLKDEVMSTGDFSMGVVVTEAEDIGKEMADLEMVEKASEVEFMGR